MVYYFASSSGAAAERGHMAGTIPKILAPVGGREQLLAAVRCGADAVYLGAKGFNARRNAENFDETALPDAVTYCHERGVEVLVTLNTLIMDDEVPRFLAELDDVAAAGADAVIVQDLFVARIIRERYPSLSIYASTQTTVHNAEGARFMEELGFSRVVLARELTIDEIRAVRAGTRLSVETFVHGAHCMCLSGACYLSSVLGTRSGNRGLCAQPCRTNFRLDGREYALSLKDMCLIPRMRDMADAGISVLKIEGRMKRPEYAAAAVTACRAQLRGETPDMETLRAVFSRSGFTDGYLTGKRTIDMFGVRTREDAAAAAGVLPKLAALYAKETPLIPVDMCLTVKPGMPARLEATDGVHTVSAEGPVPEPARAVAVTAESARVNLAQTGGTPYALRHYRAAVTPGLSLPVSAQKGLRRDALSALAEARVMRPAHVGTGWTPPAPAPHIAPETPALWLRFSAEDQIFDAPDAARILLPAALLSAKPQLIAQFGARLILELPALCFPDRIEALRETLTSLQTAGLTDVYARNPGLVRLAQEMGFTVHGGAELNILNSGSLAEYERMGLSDVTVSFELPMAKIRRLGGALPRGAIGYGRLPLMKVRACPAKGRDGCGACTGVRTLTDEKNEHFTLVCHNRQFGELLNGVPLYIGDKPFGGLDFMLLWYTTETQAEARRAYDCFRTGAAPEFPRTGGLYYRNLP